MENFNKIMYNTHTVGTKAYLFKIIGIDLEKAPKEVVDNYEKNFGGNGKKLNVIAIPEEEDKLPNYFIPDLKTSLKFCFEDRHAQLLKPLFEVKIKKQQEAMII